MSKRQYNSIGIPCTDILACNRCGAKISLVSLVNDLDGLQKKSSSFDYQKKEEENRNYSEKTKSNK